MESTNTHGRSTRRTSKRTTQTNSKAVKKTKDETISAPKRKRTDSALSAKIIKDEYEGRVLRSHGRKSTAEQARVHQSIKASRRRQDASKMLKECPHLKKDFTLIDDFVRKLKDNRKLDGEDIDKDILSLSRFDEKSERDREKIAEYFSLTEAADVVKTFYEDFLASLNLQCILYLTKDMVDQHKVYLDKVKLIRNIIWNNTGYSIAFAEDVCTSGLVEHFVTEVKILSQDGFRMTTDDWEHENPFELCVSVVFNCSRSPAARKPLRDDNLVPYLIPLLKSPSEEARLLLLLLLGNIMDETDNDLLQADRSVFDVLFEFIHESIEASDHGFHIWRLHELVEGMTSLAKNATNNIILFEKGMTVLMRVLEHGWEEEQEEAIRCIMEFAKTSNRKRLGGNEDLISVLRKLKSSPRKTLSKAAEEALHIINQ